MADIYSYFNSAQTFGFPDLAEESNSMYYLMHYFAFPIIVSCLIIYIIIILLKNIAARLSVSSSMIVFLFLSIFYLINFHRGLIRHALIENTDHTLTSFGFLLLSGSIYIIKPLWSENKKFIFFIAFSALLIVAFKFPKEDIARTSLFGKFITRTDTLTCIKESRTQISRSAKDSTEIKNYSEIVKFLDTFLEKDETFIDLTNSPMLYYYAHKVNPVFFNQPMHSSHSEYLQKRYIDEIGIYNTPFILFSMYPEVAGKTDLDGIPNAARYFLIFEYIYKNYTPYVVINNYCVWKKNDYNKPGDPHIIELYNANKSPDTTSITDLDLRINLFSNASKRKFIAVSYTCTVKENISVLLNNNGQYALCLYPDSSVAMTEITNLPNDTLKKFRFTIPEDSLLKIDKICFIESSCTPDVFSERRVCFNNLKFAPYIWGQYDERSAESRTKIITSLTKGEFTLNKGDIKKIIFDPVKDKQKGNYLILKVRNLSEGTADLIVTYGQHKISNGSFIFRIKDDALLNRYVLRMSMQYNWTANDINWISLVSDRNIKINSIEITEAD